MITYLLINLLVILFPLIFSFEKSIYHIKNISIVIKAISYVGIPFLIWDEIFTRLNIWNFNSSKIIGIKFLSLPLEEVLFFICIPYSIIFIYEIINHHYKHLSIKISWNYLLYSGFLLSLVSLFVYEKTYSAIVILLTGIFISFVSFNKHNLFQKMSFWITIIISFLGFLIINYFLTSIPVVIYNESKIIGLRIITIPIEDFFYNFLLLGLNLYFYDIIKEKSQ